MLRVGDVIKLVDGTLHGTLPDDDQLTGIATDSRQVAPGMLFVALKGSACDGHAYIQDALERGAVAVVAQQCPATAGTAFPCIQVRDSHEALGRLAAAWHDVPARDLRLVGLTGTNGKTTTSWLLEGVLRRAGYQTGVIGTVNYRYQDRKGRVIEQAAPLTTPDPMLLHGLLREMVDAGVTHVIIEASSHALDQQRLASLLFDVAVFTNLSRDHLDYHHSMEEYFQAKELLFSRHLQPEGCAVIVMPDGEQGPESDYAARLADNLSRDKILRVGMDASCDLWATVLDQDINGTSIEVHGPGGKQAAMQTSLIGAHNIANILAAAGAVFALGLPLARISDGIGAVDHVPGRLERVLLPGADRDRQPAVFVDYAHTPDGLKHVLSTLAGVTSGRLACVFGCGGDRDRGKRPLMGATAAAFADLVILTSDNPRTEEPAVILDEVAVGLARSDLKEYSLAEVTASGWQQPGWVRVEDRNEAIALATRLCQPGDVLLVAGKGHEQYQILGKRRIFFDDRVAVLNGLAAWSVEYVLKATGGQTASGHTHPWKRFGRISTDTRTLRSGDIFVALRGENFDGHNFAAQAVAKGAELLILEEMPREEPGAPVVLVSDTLRALGDLAAWRRKLFGPLVTVIGLTGSSGKTTVKEMVAAICTANLHGPEPEAERVLKTAGNFNNLIGLPLTLLGLGGQHRIAVLEMGMNQPGEIARLTEISRPDIGCINNVQAAHLLGLGSIEGVAGAKGELFRGLQESAIAVVNCDDPYVVRQARHHQGRQIGYAITALGRRRKPEVRVTRITPLGERGSRLTLHIEEWKERVELPVPGLHNVANCAAAAAIAHAAGIPGPDIVQGLTAFTNIDKRMQFDQVPGGLKVINDSYNANPASMAAALETMASFDPESRKLAALGDMLELGEAAPAAHREIGRLAARLGYTLLAVTGEYRQEVVTGAREAGMAKEQVMGFVDTVAMADWLYHLMISGRLGEDDWLLVKGSRGMRMEHLLVELQNRFDPSLNRE